MKVPKKTRVELEKIAFDHDVSADECHVEGAVRVTAVTSDPNHAGES